MFIKSPCPHCANNIEYPAESAGERVSCPHCAQELVLSGWKIAAGAIPKQSVVLALAKAIVGVVGGLLAALILFFIARSAMQEKFLMRLMGGVFFCASPVAVFVGFYFATDTIKCLCDSRGWRKGAGFWHHIGNVLGMIFAIAFGLLMLIGLVLLLKGCHLV